jgi:hypothetical protein
LTALAFLIRVVSGIRGLSLLLGHLVPFDKNMKSSCSKIAVLIALLLAAFAALDGSAADPGFTHTWTTNQLSLTVTNHTAGAVYEIYTRPVLGDDMYPWTFLGRGAVNQTNFVITDYAVQPTGFFELAVGSNWDGDGANNDIDAQPNNSSVGALAITIDFPTQGYTLQ